MYEIFLISFFLGERNHFFSEWWKTCEEVHMCAGCTNLSVVTVVMYCLLAIRIKDFRNNTKAVKK
jgi:hypothetical protein